MKRFLSAVTAVTIAAGVSTGYARTTEYRYTTIAYQDDDGKTYWTDAVGINDAGQIVGYIGVDEDTTHSLLVSGGITTLFDHPSADEGGSAAYNINNLGQIVGAYVTGDTLRGFLHTGEEYIDIVPIEGVPGTQPLGLNDAGDVAGVYWDAEYMAHGFSYDGDYTLIDYPGATETIVGGINNSGSIVGQAIYELVPPRGFLLESGTFTPIDVPGFPASNATDINDLGDIVGVTGLAPDMLRGFVLAGGEYSVLHVPGALQTIAFDINNLGHVVGRYTNDDRTWYGFLAIPIPEPATLCLMLMALGAGVLASRNTF